LKCSSTTVKKWVKRYKETGDVEEEKKAPRKRVTTIPQDKMIISTVEKNRDKSMPKIHQQLKKKRVQCSLRTLHNRIQEVGIQSLPPIKKPLLNDSHQQLRLKWAEEYKNFNFNQVIFTDESSFYIFNNVKRVWRTPWEQVVVRTVKHCAKVHAWGCFSANGFGKLFLFTSNLDSNLMCTIYKNELLPSAKIMFGDNTSDWYLQEDNDPKHKSKKCQSFKQQNNIQVMKWPAQSPDCNPIENVWGLIKNRLSGKTFKSAFALKLAIRKEWKSLDKNYAEALVQSVPKRLQAVVESSGDWTIY